MKWLFLSMILLQNIDPLVLEQKSLEARELLNKESITFKRAGKGGNARIVSRDIILAVYSQVRDAIELVRLEVAVPKSLRNTSFNFKVATPGYSVERIAGKGITRLEFNIADFLVLDSRHLHLERQRTSPRDLFYAPYSDIFQNEYFTKSGFKKYSNIVKESQDELCTTGAKSRKYPEKLLCDVFPDHLFLTLGAIEQMDDREFFENPKYSVKKFLAHVARNGEEAFSYSVSVDGARGLMQFMNSRRIATYDAVRKRYPKVKLIADHEKGAADMKNSIKAAICLADMNLAELPQSAKNKFEAIIVAHNAGAGRAKNFLRGKSIPKETKNFLKKYRETWKILESR